MSTITVKELAAPTGFDLKIAAGETLDLKSQGTVTMPTGSVLQVVSMNYSSETSTTSSSYISTGLTLAITPTSTSSKILVICSLNSVRAGANTVYAKFVIKRAGVEIDTFENELYFATVDDIKHLGTSYLDSPNTASAVTYDIQKRRSGGSGNLIMNSGGSKSTLTLMEVAG